MDDDAPTRPSRTVDPTPRTRNGHHLIVVTERLPWREPSDYGGFATAKERIDYGSRYWRCRCCGQELSTPDAFREPCPSDGPPLPLSECGYDPLEARTRRALTESMAVRFGERGSSYPVDAVSGRTYEVDIAAETCTCPDFRKRSDELPDGCKHLRRVHLEIVAGHVPRPDGEFETGGGIARYLLRVRASRDA